MADKISTVNYYSVTIPNKPGEAARILAALKAAGVNMTGLWGYPVQGRAQLDMIPDDAAAFLKAIRKLGLKASQKLTALHLNGKDRKGALLEVLGKLAAAGVNVAAAQAIHGGAKRFGALIQVAAADLKKARKALGV